MSEFERTGQLFGEEEIVEEDDEFPIWVIIVSISFIVIFIGVIVYICCLMRKNKQHRGLQERAIIRELALAKEEGIVIPDDLEKRLSRFQSIEDSEK